MKKFQSYSEFINESFYDTKKVYIQQNTLWVAHSPGSGSTTQIKGDPDKFRGYFTNKAGDEHYDGSVSMLTVWADTDRSYISKKGKTSLHKIPCYWGYKNPSDLSIWGGEIQPDYFLFMLVQTIGTGDTIIGFFKTQREANAFWNK